MVCEAERKDCAIMFCKERGMKLMCTANRFTHKDAMRQIEKLDAIGYHRVIVCKINNNVTVGRETISQVGLPLDMMQPSQ